VTIAYILSLIFSSNISFFQLTKKNVLFFKKERNLQEDKNSANINIFVSFSSMYCNFES